MGWYRASLIGISASVKMLPCKNSDLMSFLMIHLGYCKWEGIHERWGETTIDWWEVLVCIFHSYLPYLYYYLWSDKSLGSFMYDLFPLRCFLKTFFTDRREYMIHSNTLASRKFVKRTHVLFFFFAVSSLGSMMQRTKVFLKDWWMRYKITCLVCL